MANYTLSHTGQQLDSAVKKVNDDYADVSGVTASAGDVLSGKKIVTAQGNVVTGNIQSKAATTITPGTSDQKLSKGLYLSGDITIKGDENLAAENIRSNITIFGKKGTYEGTSGSGTAPSLQSKSVTPSKSSQSVTADSGYDGLSTVTVNAIPDEYIIPSGTKEITSNGTIDVTDYKTASVNVANSSGGTGIDTSDATAVASDILNGKTAYSNGSKITGKLNYLTSDDSERTYETDSIAKATLYDKLVLRKKFTTDIAFLTGSQVAIRVDLTELGDATASDVAAGKTFTSSEGIKVTGTAESGSGSSDSNNNCEAYLIDVTNPYADFKTASGTIKAYGYGKGTTIGYTTPQYAFQGDKYLSISSYGSGTTTNLSLSVDSSGKISGLPTMTSGTILVVRGI